MDIVRPVLPAAPAAPAPRGRHRAPRRPGRLGRATLAVVAAGAPVVPAALLAAPAAHAETDWDALAQCESGGDWGINTGNGFGGGLQFTDSTWRAFGGSGQPEDASRSEQIRVAERVKAEQGMNAWPTCSRKTGQTDDSPNSSVPSADEESSSSPSEDDAGSAGRDAEDSGSDAENGSGSDAGSDAGSDSGSETRQVRGATPSAGSYTVRAGDTLSSIAASHGASWRSIAQANGDVLTDPNMIFPGQTLSMG
ncbi:LysM peptidoglycan-binding domain-containing protein [Actinomycetospora lemnae]|uniref:Transglycosylase family protein n=1 Tax=Actinomycetospora lemnae TaxID=3019891 RepID=A0ABT5T2C4_9PSEU|nr:transglycosylase family protein [Actinomycetospora sp. DW7H6]MDD7969159.1 transglycosylase family protein [Actinomycetospora sp. DW7H6]